MGATLINTGQSLPGRYQAFPIFISLNGGNDSGEKHQEKSIYVENDLAKSKLSILLADDDVDDRDLFKEALGEVQFKINLQFAEDGKNLLENLKDCKELPDIIFLDLNMPHKSGIECLVEIRKNERCKHIPIVIYSTSSSVKDVEDTFEKGANLYVKKPSSFNELKNTLNKVLGLDWNKQKPHTSRSQYLFASKN